MKRKCCLLTLLLSSSIYSNVAAQHSIARQWNEMHLTAIRKDFARPTHHARNLFHVTMAMYDAWAAYDSVAKPFLLGDTVGGFICPFTGVPAPADVKAAREEAISYAAYRLLKWRFRNSPGASLTLPLMDSLMLTLGYDTSYHATDYANGTPADLGNYIFEQIKAFGLQDGSNEQNNYANQYYTPVNQPLIFKLPGNPTITDPNLWQPLSFDYFIDQAGNLIPGNTPGFLSPEWGKVTPFALADSNKSVYTRDGDTFNVYHDPGPPPFLDTLNGAGDSDYYKWNFALVSAWSSHLDPNDSVMWDISPASIGNAHDYPASFADYPNFYDLENGGDNSTGYALNPKTGQPYTPQIVPRGDYTRVLAEFWADGPTSETPPGHWFTILNYVNDHPQFEKRWGGKGPVMDELEWDVKAYFAMGGAVHDAAICAWGIKGWYDYVRPISAIRYMASKGQSTDTTLSNYSPLGIPLIPGFIEMVQPGEPLDSNGLHTGEIKLRAWQGFKFFYSTPAPSPLTEEAGVDWILADRWMPYQRSTFVTPPFAGYISGHSTYSRTAAELMTLLTGDEYFPGGMSEFVATQNQYLIHEDGPSVTVTLQWAKYKDASDQCSLSRIWGGIHPPADDIPGRLLGMKLGPQAFHYAERLYDSRKPEPISVIPNPMIVSDSSVGTGEFSLTVEFNENMDTTVKPVITFPVENPLAKTLTFNTGTWINWTTYRVTYDVADSSEKLLFIDVRVSGARDVVGNEQETFDAMDNFIINTVNPAVSAVIPSVIIISDDESGTSSFTLTINFTEDMSTGFEPAISFPVENPSGTLTFHEGIWINSTTYEARYDVTDASEEIPDIDIHISGAFNASGNEQVPFSSTDNFSIDTKNPIVLSILPSTATITANDVGAANFTLTVTFNEAMDTSAPLPVSFPVENPLAKTLTYNSGSSGWLNTSTFAAKYDVADSSELLQDIDVHVEICKDLAGNVQLPFDAVNSFSIDMKGSGIPKNEALSLMRVYPNPAEGKMLMVDLTQLNSDARIQLYNGQGMLVHSQAVSVARNKLIQIDGGSLSSGLYLLLLKGNDFEQQLKVQLHK